MANKMNLGGNIRDKDFDGSAWSKNNDDSFRELVAQAKRKRAVKTEAEELPKPEAASELDASRPMLLSNSYASPATAGPQSPEKQLSDEQQAPADGMNANEALLDPSHLQDEPKTDIVLASTPGISSQRRFFEDDTPLPFEPPSSQHGSSQLLDKDISLSSDLATVRPLQH